MSVHEVLIEALDELSNKDFRTFKWYLSTNLLDGCKPIPGHRLENAERTDTVTQITKSYGNETAVTISVKILRKMNQNTAALALEKAYAESEEGKAASSTTSSSAAAAAPAQILADKGSVIFAPIVGDTKGTWNVTINKS